MKTYLIALVIIVLAVGSFIFLRTNRFVTRQNASSAPPAPSAADETAYTNARFKSTQLSCTAGRCKLDIEIAVNYVCHLGDMNLIQSDIERASDKPNLLLAVEPLVVWGIAEPILAEEISLSKLIKGYRKTIQLPPFTKPMQLGVFLCKDSKQEKRCSRKTPEDFDSMYSKLFAQGNNPKYRSPDWIYFYQALLWEAENKLSFFFDPEPQAITDKVYEERANYVKRHTAQLFDEELLAIGKSKELSRKLRSMPLELSPSKIVLVLPWKQMGQGGCQE